MSKTTVNPEEAITTLIERYHDDKMFTFSVTTSKDGEGEPLGCVLVHRVTDEIIDILYSILGDSPIVLVTENDEYFVVRSRMAEQYGSMEDAVKTAGLCQNKPYTFTNDSFQALTRSHLVLEVKSVHEALTKEIAEVESFYRVAFGKKIYS
ncbi:MAG: hypothetical protein LBQ21_04420 [Clostridiales Family XIII bacterium]|jgi:hypothetical protein|nr:hypothetical protein [Clostridiales Family XIII bacterium]